MSKPASANWADALSALRDSLPQASEQPTAQEPESNRQKKPRLDISFEKKGRAGKQATIISGFPDDFPNDEIAALAATLKSRLGTGGSARGGEILIQGDRRQSVNTLLESLGYKSRII